MSDTLKEAVAQSKSDRLFDEYMVAQDALIDRITDFAIKHTELLHDSREGHEVLDALDMYFDAFEAYDDADSIVVTEAELAAITEGGNG